MNSIRPNPDELPSQRRERASRMGRDKARGWWQHETLGRRLAEWAPEFDLTEGGEGQPAGERSASATDAAEPSKFTTRGGIGYLWCLSICGTTAVIAAPLQPIFDLATIVMVFLLVAVPTLEEGEGVSPSVAS